MNVSNPKIVNIFGHSFALTPIFWFFEGNNLPLHFTRIVFYKECIESFCTSIELCTITRFIEFLGKKWRNIDSKIYFSPDWETKKFDVRVLWSAMLSVSFWAIKQVSTYNLRWGWDLKPVIFLKVQSASQVRMEKCPRRRRLVPTAVFVPVLATSIYLFANVV